MTAVSWTGPVLVLIGRVPADLSGVWSLLYAAELASLRLGSVPGAGDPGAFGAGLSLREAVEELEWFHPDVITDSAAVDLGPVPDGEDGRAAVRELLDALVDLVSGVVADPLVSGEDLLMLARVVGRVMQARDQLTATAPPATR